MDGVAFRKKMKQPHAQLGVTPCDLPRNQLPTCAQVVGRIMKMRLEEMETRGFEERQISTKKLISAVSAEVRQLWIRTSVPAKRIDKVAKCIAKLWGQKDNIKKHSKRCDTPMIVSGMASLFDISLTSNSPEHPDDRAFLEDQRTVRQLYIDSVDRQTTERWTAREERRQRKERRHQQSAPADVRSARQPATPPLPSP